MVKKEKLTIEYIKKLKIQKKEADQELAHVNADELLCDLLIELGYKKIVRIYNKIEKWYA